MPPGRSRLVLAVVAASAFFMSVDLTFVNVALPDIGDEFAASTADLAWVVDAYTVALTSLLIPGAALAERFGRRRIFLLGMLLFTLASVLCAVAPSLATLLAGRALMGVGAGMMLAPALALTAMAFPPAERSRALATWATAGALGLSLGPVVGGLLVGVAGWRWAFMLPVPLLAVAVAVGRAVLPEGRGTREDRFDVLGVLLALFALVPLVAALIEAPRLGWTSPWVIAGLALGVTLLVVFAAREARSPAPVFDVRALAQPVIAGSSLALFASYVTFLGLLFLITIDLQQVAGLGPVEYGLLLTPMAITYWVVSRIGARVAATGAFRGPMIVGLVSATLAFVVPAIAPNTPPWTLPALVLLGTAAGMIVPVCSATVMNALPPEAMSTSSSLSVVARFAGGAVGVAVIASAVSAVADTDAALTAGYWTGAVFVAALAVGAIVAITRSGAMGEGRPIARGGGGVDPGPI
jgi:EmrB/QacA subfamily drug resistance transporter